MLLTADLDKRSLLRGISLRQSAKAYQVSSLKRSIPMIRQPDLARILVLGVGGAGSNTVNRLMESGITGVECIAVNTDKQHLDSTRAHVKILIGSEATRGQGAQGSFQIDRRAVQESIIEISPLLDNVDVVFITAGMGGETGSVVAPALAKLAREESAVVVGAVTMPSRAQVETHSLAVKGLKELREACDTVAVVENDRVMELFPIPANDYAFSMADRIVANMVKGISESLAAPSLINMDFAEFKTVMKTGGIAVAAIGESSSPFRAEQAARNALGSPLLRADWSEATGALIHVSGDEMLSLAEASRVAQVITESLRPGAFVTWGATVDSSIYDSLRVTLLLTGVKPSQLLTGFGVIPMEMYNLEPDVGTDQNLDLDLDLYQLENS
jgi:cell division protein FtsZ